MKPSDCPHAVGTAEHSAWIRDVYIPTVNDQRMAEDGAKVGAESQGRKVIHGFTHNLDGTKKEPTFTLGGSTWPIKSFSFTRLEEGDLDLGVTNNFKVFFEEFTGITGLNGGPGSFHYGPGKITFIVDDLPEVSGAGYSRGGPSRAKRRAKPVKAKRERNQMVPKKVRECPRHGGPADRCRICQR